MLAAAARGKPGRRAPWIGACRAAARQGQQRENVLAAAMRRTESRTEWGRRSSWWRLEKISGRREQRGSAVCVWERRKKVVAARG
jgi:hypothetical protein